MNIEIIKKLEINLPSELEEFANSGHDNVSDYAHEYADNCDEVFYPAKAEELYHQADYEERDEAEEMNSDCGGFPEKCGMAQRFTILAYWIVRNRIESTIREQAMEAAEEIREAIESLEEIAGALEDIS